jgi:hypothetical protein
MLACILNTKPVNLFSVGSTNLTLVFLEIGSGLILQKESRSSFIPKLFTALPKNTGAILPDK